MIPLHLGVDPGAHGAVALLAPRSRPFVPALLEVAKLPGARERVNTRDTIILDAMRLVEMLQDWEAKHDGAILTCTIERVGALPKDRAPQAFAFGRAYGAVRAVIEGRGTTVRTVPVSVWRGAVGVLVPDAARERSQLKAACRERAMGLWPDRADWFKRVKDTDAAEAALIGLAGIE